MTKTDEKVLAAVEEALRKDPSASVDDLFELAKGVSADVASLSRRQFHARYPLQVKRRLAPARRRGTRKAAPRNARRARTPAPPARDAVRAVFLRFASDLAAAEARKDLVKVVAGVDRYVDEVLEAAGHL